MSKQRKGVEVTCLDAVGRARTARVFPVSLGRVGIQAPPGEVMVLTLTQLHALWVAARQMCQESWQSPDTARRQASDPVVSAGSAA